MRVLTYVAPLVLLEATMSGNEREINLDFDAKIFASEEDSVSDDFASGGLSASEKYDKIISHDLERRGGESLGLDDFYSVVSQKFLASNLKPLPLQSVEKRLYNVRRRNGDGSAMPEKQVYLVTDAHKEIVGNLMTERGLKGLDVNRLAAEAFRERNLSPLTDRNIKELMRKFRAQNGLSKTSLLGKNRDRIIADLISQHSDMTRMDLHGEFLRRMKQAGFDCQMTFRTFEYHINLIRKRIGIYSKRSWKQRNNQEAEIMIPESIFGEEDRNLPSAEVVTDLVESGCSFFQEGTQSGGRSILEEGTQSGGRSIFQGGTQTGRSIFQEGTQNGHSMFQEGTEIDKRTDHSLQDDHPLVLIETDGPRREPKVGWKADRVLTSILRSNPALSARELYEALLTCTHQLDNVPHERQVKNWLAYRLLLSKKGRFDLPHLAPNLDQIFPWVGESSLYICNTDGPLSELHSQGDIPIDFQNDSSAMFADESFSLQSIGPLTSHIHGSAMPVSESGEEVSFRGSLAHESAMFSL